MTYTQQKPKRLVAQPGAARMRWLVVALALAAVASAIIAIFATAEARAAFGGAALVFAIAALWSGGAASGADPHEPQFDLEAPPAVTPLPQSPVTQTYAPGAPPNKSLEQTREKQSAKFIRRRARRCAQPLGVMQPLVELLEPELQAIIGREIAAGNAVAQADRNWPNAGAICILLRDEFRLQHDVQGTGIRYAVDNDPHGPIAVYAHPRTRNCVYCSTF